MLRIYRIEHRDTRIGPFQTDTPYTQGLARRAGNTRHLVAPDKDGLVMGPATRNHVFGCPDLDTLKQWVFFERSIRMHAHIVRKLDAAGFVLAEYRVKAQACSHGRSGIQVMFEPTEARESGQVAYRALGELLH